MGVHITRIGPGLYEAVLQLPDKAPWESDEPMPHGTLFYELAALGCPETAIRDAFEVADPDWED